MLLLLRLLTRLVLRRLRLTLWADFRFLRLICVCVLLTLLLMNLWFVWRSGVSVWLIVNLLRDPGLGFRDLSVCWYLLEVEIVRRGRPRLVVLFCLTILMMSLISRAWMFELWRRLFRYEL